MPSEAPVMGRELDLSEYILPETVAAEAIKATPGPIMALHCELHD